MTPDQSDAIQRARESALRIKRFADKAHDLGLTVLEGYLREASVACQAGADFQIHASRLQEREGLLQQKEKTVVDGLTVNVQKCDRCGMTIAECPCHDADRIADAMKRRDLI